MTLLNILKHPDINLKKKATNIDKITPEITQLIKNMIETMIFYKGIGLAATQVDIQKKLIVVNIDKKTTPLILINPKITYKKDYIIEQEGCLSFPNIFVKVKRNKIIKVTFKNLSFQKREIHADNLLSVCIQHEIDHLNGITLYDKMSPLKKKLLKQ